MAKRPRNAIRFGCPRCQTRLFARPSQVGTKRRCPRCQYVFTVPTAQEADARAAKQGPEAEYAFSEQVDSSEPQKHSISVVCPLCKTRMYATPDQVGQTLECPDCETKVLVSPPPEPTSEETEDHQPAPGEEYPVWGVGQPTQDYQETYIPVVCGLCHTRMLATGKQVGQTLVCPDCGTPSVVPPPPEQPTPENRSNEQDDEETTYRLCTGAGQPGPGSQAHLTHIPVICSLCHTRLHATLDQVGQEIVCPDCLTSNTVPPPPKRLPKIDPMEGAGEAIAHSVPIRPPEFQPIFEYSWLKELEEPEADDENQPRERPDSLSPSASALFVGLLGFLFSSSVLGRWTIFSVAGITTLCFAGAAIHLARSGTMLDLVLAVLFSALTGLSLLVSLSVIATSLVAVVVDTAAGNKQVENWPEGPMADWLFNALYVINAAAVSVLPGAGLRWLLGSQGLGTGPVMELSAFVLFPIVLLSMLERGSAMSPYSPAILQSLRTTFWTWGLFYLATGLFLLIAGRFVSGLTSLLDGLGIALALPFGMAAMLLYFRLLGRLAWVAAGGSEKPTAEPLAKDEPSGQDTR